MAQVPACTGYFLAFEYVSRCLRALRLSPLLVPLVGGAAAGVAAWLPVYPIDVVKTNLQCAVDAGQDESFGACAQRVWREGGAAAFWDGLGPKLARAVVNHATTFAVFELLVGWWAA